MNIFIDQTKPDDLIGNTLTEGLIACEHTVYNIYNGTMYDGGDVDFVVTTDGSSFTLLPNALSIHVGTKSPLPIASITHEKPRSLYGILESYYNKNLLHKIPLEKRPVDICVMCEPTNYYHNYILKRFPYNNIEMILHPDTKDATQILSKSKIVVIPRSDTSDEVFLWRAMASGGFIILEDRDSYNMFPPLRDKHCANFTNEGILRRELEIVLTDPLQHQHIADAAFNTGRRYHTSRIRGRQFVTYLLSKTANILLMQQNIK